MVLYHLDKTEIKQSLTGKAKKIRWRKRIICSQLSMVAQTNEEIPHGTVMTFAEKHPFIVENRKLLDDN